MEFRASGPGRLVEPLLALVLSHDSRRDDQRLKAVLESRPTTANPPTTDTTHHISAAGKPEIHGVLRIRRPVAAGNPRAADPWGDSGARWIVRTLLPLVHVLGRLGWSRGLAATLNPAQRCDRAD